jgi:cytochrome c-type biogenesis protein CcmH
LTRRLAWRGIRDSGAGTSRVLIILLALCALGATMAPAVGAAPVNEDTVREIGTQLRCVVCQSLSVADSPSETASQMRGVIRERLAAGQTPEQIKAYFVDKYGLWILLEPPRKGFSLLVWVVPYAGLLGGLVLVGFVVRRWSRRPRGATIEAPPVDEATRQRIRRELMEMDRE